MYRKDVEATGEFDYWWLKGIFDEPAPRPDSFAAGDGDEFDVIVVGSGMAGMSSAVLAHDAGASVLVLEAADAAGGTTYKSGAGMWVPNNALMRALGINDDKAECLRFMARIAYPDRFDPDAPDHGVGAWEWEKMNAFYDNASDAIEALRDAGALEITPFRSFTDKHPAMVPYHSHLDMSIQGFYRHIMPLRPDGLEGIGWELVRQLAAAVNERGIEVRLRHRVTDVIQHDGAVVGVTGTGPDGDVALYARKGVVFATGGFPHNLDLLDEFFRGPLYSSCAVPTAQGDFVEIGRRLDSELTGMRNGWFYEEIFENAAIDREATDGGIGVPPGDAMIYVNTEGKRVVNEKIIYQERAKVYFHQDEDGSYPNRVLFMVYDEFMATDTRPWTLFDIFFPHQTWVIKADTLQELGPKIQERLDKHADLAGAMQLAPDFGAQLAGTVERFNGFARAGKDEDFHRGESLQQWDWHGPAREGNDKNPTMFPFREEGPYYAALICGMVLDTNGGPRTNARSQVIRRDGSPIPGLYGAGNCVAAVAGDGYLSGGSTLGPAAAFAYLAAKHVVQEPTRDVRGARGVTATA